jgi:hypothetical protein
VAMNLFCKSYDKTDLASLHYVIFIEPLAVMPTEFLSFACEQFMNNSVIKLIEEKTNNPFILLEEHFFASLLLQKKIMKLNSEI